jgi:hypothetical protein
VLYAPLMSVLVTPIAVLLMFPASLAAAGTVKQTNVPELVEAKQVVVVGNHRSAQDKTGFVCRRYHAEQ